MTIYDDGIKQEKVQLPRKSIPEMHALMVEKGFVRKEIKETPPPVGVVAKDVGVPNNERDVSRNDPNNLEAVPKIQEHIADATIEEAVNGGDTPSKQLKRLRVNEEEVTPRKQPPMW
eukprot:CAMPEP_0198258364 /NCGR_PEP_ID=MMETSP1447-20131203/7826_1 /TAXON_ID=420782 /ORGANISM="Chaetoceros dichaeta, Strain CCMP1751" /LENGTH=116 /DNA_ID=CAMNT_0043945475 /DNA_START=254 /DNA_END=601 /DNA_ORIENTATION=+